MENKKNSADWYMAATYWLTTMVLFVVINAIVLIALSSVFSNPTIVAIGFIIIDPIVMWLAVKYSVKYLDKTYIIKNANQIVILSTAYVALIAGGFRIYKFIQTGIFSYEYIGFILALLVFYLMSKKYVKNNINL